MSIVTRFLQESSRVQDDLIPNMVPRRAGLISDSATDYAVRSWNRPYSADGDKQTWIPCGHEKPTRRKTWATAQYELGSLLSSSCFVVGSVSTIHARNSSWPNWLLHGSPGKWPAYAACPWQDLYGRYVVLCCPRFLAQATSTVRLTNRLPRAQAYLGTTVEWKKAQRINSVSSVFN